MGNYFPFCPSIGEDVVDFLPLVVGVNQVQHVYQLSSLAEAFDPSQSLLKPRWVPQKIVVDQLRERIEMVPRIS